MEIHTFKESFTWPPIVSKRACEWCSSPVWLREQFSGLCQSPWRLWPSDLLLDLQYCGDCVNEYHQIKDEFMEKIPSKKKKLWLGDVERLSLWIKQALENTSLTSCSTLEVLNNLENKFPAIPSNNSDSLKQSLEVPIQEVLQYPQFLFDKNLFQLFNEAVVTLIESGSPPVLQDICPGIYILLVHPSPKLRKWAEKTVKRLPKVTLEGYDNFTTTIQSLVEVATLNLFELVLEEPSDITMTTYLPGHLFETPSVYWNGFLRLLLCMEKDVIALKLLGVTGHRDLPDTIINVIEGIHGKEKAVFWPAFNCLVIILESCSARLWPMITRTPYDVLDIITNQQVYVREVKQYLLQGSGSSCEQAVNDSHDSQLSSQEFAFESQGFSRDVLPKTALAWFQTFVQSVIDFGDVATKCIQEIIEILNKYSGNMDVKIKIASIVSRVMRSKQLSPLASTAHIWVPHVLKLATQLDETNKKVYRSVIIPAREMITSLMSKSENQANNPQVPSINFKELSEEKLEDITKCIINQFQNTSNEEKTSRLKCRRQCARKSMGRKTVTATPVLPSTKKEHGALTLQLKNETVVGPVQTNSVEKESSVQKVQPKDEMKVYLHDMKKENAYSHFIKGLDKLKKKHKEPLIVIDGNGAKEENAEVNVKEENAEFNITEENAEVKVDVKEQAGEVKPQLKVRRGGKLFSTVTTTLTPVVKLEDCRKTMPKHNVTWKEMSHSEGTKDKPIDLDDSDEVNYNSTEMRRTPPTPNFEIFKKRSNELSEEKLKKISKTKAVLSIDTASNKLLGRKRTRVSSKTKALEDSDETSSLESNSEDEIQIKRTPRRKKVMIKSDDDDTDSMDDEPLDVLCKDRLSPKRKNNSGSRHSHLHRSSRPNSSNSSLPRSSSPRKASPHLQKSSDFYFTKTTKPPHMPKPASVKNPRKLSSDYSPESTSVLIPKSPSPQIPKSPSLHVPTSSPHESASGMNLSDFKAMPVYNINVNNGSSRTDKSDFSPRGSQFEDSCSSSKVTYVDQKSNYQDEHMAQSHEAKLSPMSAINCLNKDNTMPSFKKMDEQLIVLEDKKLKKVTNDIQMITEMFDSDNDAALLDDLHLTDVPGHYDLKIENDLDLEIPTNMTGGKYDAPARYSGTESSDSDNMNRYSQLIKSCEEKYEDKGNFLQNLVRNRNEEKDLSIKEEVGSDSDDVFIIDPCEPFGKQSKSFKSKNVKIKTEMTGSKDDPNAKTSKGTIPHEEDYLFGFDDDHLFNEIELEDIHPDTAKGSSSYLSNNGDLAHELQTVEGYVSKDFEKVFEEPKKDHGQSSYPKTETQNEEEDMSISDIELDDDDLLATIVLDDCETHKIDTGADVKVKKEYNDEDWPQQDELIDYSISELLDSEDILNEVDLLQERETKRTHTQSLSSAKPFDHEEASNWRRQNEDDNFNANQVESAFASVEADIRSSDEDSDDDIVEIFCSQSSKPPSVQVKIEKPDDHEMQVASKARLEILAQDPPPPPPPTLQPQPQEYPVPPKVPPQVKTLFTGKPADIVSTMKLTEDHLVKQVLSWRVEWLDMTDRTEIPVYKVLDNAEKLPKSFDSIDEYCASFGKLLVIEAWEQAVKEWRDPRCKRGRKYSNIISVSDNRSYKIIRSTICDVSHSEINERLFPEEKALVKIAGDNYLVFGLVEKVEQEKIYRRASSGSDGNDSFREPAYNLTFTIRTISSVRPKDGTNIELEVVTCLLTFFRQWSALMSFSQQNFLVKDILRPRGVRYFCSDEKPKEIVGNEMYNESQIRVIKTVSKAVEQPLVIPRICLVQGPPGTGKSHTIVGMVTEILNHQRSQSIQCQPSQLLPEKPRILICCPSNEGLDELIRKLIRAKPRKTNPSNNNMNRNKGKEGSLKVNCGDFSLVRVGRMSKIHASVKSVTLEHLTRDALATAGFGQQENYSVLKTQNRKIEKEIENIEKQKFMLGKDGPHTEEQKITLERLEEQRSSLASKKQKLDMEFRKKRDLIRMESRIKKEILNKTDIVCTTLSGSGNSNFMNDMRGTNGKKIPFSCVIVDEACQCTELDILIPLQYKSSKLILVGDPEQLPATVISKDAKKLLYGRSMFDRLYRFFKELPRSERPVHLLDVQYRMHPEIAHFPSKHVYNDNIHTDDSLLHRSFPVKTHYALFNVYGGRETNDRKGSISNRKEAQLILSLCKHLVRNRLKPSDIGIITPYRTQLIDLKQLLRCSGDIYRDIEVNTVDGFQGREKNIIIMSCVRSGKNIGFLECVNRLNVALTRARHALYVFGNLDSLMKADFWKKLVDDASHRGLIHKVDTVDDVKRTINLTTSPSKHHSSHTHGSDRRTDQAVHRHVERSTSVSSIGKEKKKVETVNIFQRFAHISKHGNESPSPVDSNHDSKALSSKPTEAVTSTRKRRISNDSDDKVSKKVRFGKATVTEYSGSRMSQSYSYPIEGETSNTPIHTDISDDGCSNFNDERCKAIDATSNGVTVNSNWSSSPSTNNAEVASTNPVTTYVTNAQQNSNGSTCGGKVTKAVNTDCSVLPNCTGKAQESFGRARPQRSQHHSRSRSSVARNQHVNKDMDVPQGTHQSNDPMYGQSSFRSESLSGDWHINNMATTQVTHHSNDPMYGQSSFRSESLSGDRHINNMATTQGTHHSNDPIHNQSSVRYKTSSTSAVSQHINKSMVTTQGAHQSNHPIDNLSPQVSTISSTTITGDGYSNKGVVKPQEAQRQPHQEKQSIEHQTNTRTNNVSDIKLDEVASRVRDKTKKPRNPVVILPSSYRGGRGGRLHSLENRDPRDPEQLRDWQPHGGPRERRAPRGSGIIQSTRTRAVHGWIGENAPRTQRRPSLRENCEKIKKRSRRK